MWLLGRPGKQLVLPRGRFAALPQENFMRAPGESDYQHSLARLRASCRPGREGRPSFPVALIPEPENPYDAHAIAVMGAARYVGYPPREDALRYVATRRALAARGYDGAHRMALVTGGEPDRPNFGGRAAARLPRDV